jgi:hypothetical protein
VDKYFTEGGWLSIFTFDYELDGAAVPKIKAVMDISGKK